MFFLSHRLRSLRTGTSDTNLDFYPQELSTVEVIQVIVIFIGRQILALLGLGNRFQSANKGSQNADSLSVPELHLSMPFCLAEKNFFEYAEAVGASRDNAKIILEDPKQACLMLSAFSEPAFLLLLAHHRCPVQPLGSVNVRNKFELLRFDLCNSDALFDRSGYEARARLSPIVRKAKRGLEIDFEVDVVHVKQDVVVFRQVFTMLQFIILSGGSNLLEKKDDATQIEAPWEKGIQFQVEKQLTMIWARICKDYNPIHISRTAAKIFGFPGRLIHGNHAFAAGLHLLKPEQGETTPHGGRESHRWNMEVHFRRPLAMPCKVMVQSKWHGGTQLFRISKGERTCITGSLERLDNLKI